MWHGEVFSSGLLDVPGTMKMDGTPDHVHLVWLCNSVTKAAKPRLASFLFSINVTKSLSMCERNVSFNIIIF